MFIWTCIVWIWTKTLIFFKKVLVVNALNIKYHRLTCDVVTSCWSQRVNYLHTAIRCDEVDLLHVMPYKANCSIVIGCVRVMINKLNFISNRVVSRVVGVRWNGGRLDNVISCIRVVEIQPNTTYVNSRSNQGKHTALRRLHSRCSWSASVLMILGLHFWLDFWLAFPLVML